MKVLHSFDEGQQPAALRRLHGKEASDQMLWDVNKYFMEDGLLSRRVSRPDGEVAHVIIEARRLL